MSTFSKLGFSWKTEDNPYLGLLSLSEAECTKMKLLYDEIAKDMKDL
jgi:hypothetical protein